jgi:hypothetical protein
MPAALRFVFIALGACAYSWIELTTSLREEMRGEGEHQHSILSFRRPFDAFAALTALWDESTDAISSTAVYVISLPSR